MDMMITGYVASTAEKAAYALEPENVLAVCVTGADPYGDAKSYAKDYARAEDMPSYVYTVMVRPEHMYEIHKEVVGSVHPDA